MAQGLPSRTFSTLAEFEDAAESATKKAMIWTLNYFKHKLSDLAESHIYNNAYKCKWYHRTNWLKEKDAIEGYIYKNTKNAIGGGVRFKREVYDSFNEPFQHGNPTKYLPMNSYLEIMNNSSLLPSGDKNPFHFPTGSEIDRGHFYDEFLALVDKEFDSVFEEKWQDALSYMKTGRIPLHTNSSNTNNSSTGVPSLNTGTLGGRTSNAWKGTVTVTDASGGLVSSTKY